MRIGTIAQLWRYPVKSMGGERRTAVRLTRRGIPGDRGWAVYDETRNGITGAKRLPALRGCLAHYPSEPAADAASPPAEISLPDGSRFRTDAHDAAHRLSAAFGRPLLLHQLGPVGSATGPRITSADESPETVRAV